MEQRKRPMHVVRLLAFACEMLLPRSATRPSAKMMRAVLEKRMLFLGRFELDRGAIIHKSPTSAVIKEAIDRSTKDECRMALTDVHEEDDTCHRSKRTVVLEK
jgi:hypothetical protein